jgi:N-dimethylarginine dimethylaminohydrolase
MGTTNELFCVNEYDPLKKLLLCEPQHMRISEIINETQRLYAEENIDQELAAEQHDAFVESLRNQGVEAILLPHVEKFPEQVFTRDIGFTIGQRLFISHMGRGIRQGEDNILIDWLQDNHYPYHNLTTNSIEGGDVIIDRDTVFVAVSGRTSEKAIQNLTGLLSGYKVVLLRIDRAYLHLDCVFNVLSPEDALIFSPALQREDLDQLSSRYDLIEVDKSEQFKMGTNVLSIGNKKVYSLPVNKKVNKELRSRGYDVIEVDISEIIKSGGSFRCCTLPLLRRAGNP